MDGRSEMADCGLPGGAPLPAARGYLLLTFAGMPGMADAGAVSNG